MKKIVGQVDVEIPVLLQREHAIQNGKEWDNVQIDYRKHRVAIQQRSNDAEAALAIVEIFTQEARITGKHKHYYPAALQLIDQVLSSDSISPELTFYALRLRSGVLLSQRHFLEALNVALQAEKIRPHDAQLQGVLVDCYVELGHYDKAIAASKAMVAGQPDIQAYARISYLREMHGDLDGALQAIQLAISSGKAGSEETAWAGLQQAKLLHRNNHSDAAERILNDILIERPNYPFAQGALAAIELAKGNLASAKTYVDEAIKTVPDVGFYITLAKYYKHQNELEAFAKTLDKIMTLLADDVQTGRNMDLEYANVYLDLLDDPETALKYMQNAYDARPDNIDVNREMAQIYKALKKPIHLDYHLKKAVRTNSKHPALRMLAGALSDTLKRLG